MARSQKNGNAACENDLLLELFESAEGKYKSMDPVLQTDNTVEFLMYG